MTGDTEEKADEPIPMINEEDLKAKVILPALESYGIETADLLLEKSFTIKLGKNSHKIASGENVTSAGGRLDILIRRGGKNLLVVEAKHPDNKITPEDVDQGVSYARLLHPMVPYCLVTTGKDSRLVDVITKQDVSKETLPEEWPSPTLSEELQRETLKAFVGQSVENLRTLCRAQLHVRMEPVQGSETERHKKYIPDLYQPRRVVDQALDRFLETDRVFFAVVDEAGSGKTCWLCRTAQRLEEHGVPVFFYMARDLASGLLDAVADDLAWTLSQASSKAQAIRRMLEVFGDRNVILCVDGLENLETDSMRRVLDESYHHVSDGRLKIVVTCTMTAFRSLCEQSGVPAAFAEELGRGGDDRRIALGSLEPDREFPEAVAKYRRFYSFEGSIARRLWRDMQRCPLLLRLGFEAASRSSVRDMDYDLGGLYEAYWTQVVRRPDANGKVERFLVVLAKLLYDQNTEEVRELELRQSLGLGILDDLPEELFLWGILIRKGEGEGATIRFYFDRIRDYAIAFHAAGWARLSPDEFAANVADESWDGVRGEALRTYYSLASDEHRLALDRDIRERAGEYLEQYDTLLDEHFSSLRRVMEGGGEAGIGFFGLVYINTSPPELAMWGLFPSETMRREIVLEPMSVRPVGGRLMPTEPASDVARISLGVRSMRLGHRGGVLWGGDMRADSAHRLLSQLEDLVRKGLLDETANKVLLSEKVLSGWRRLVGGWRRRRRDSGDSTVPLSSVAIEIAKIGVRDRLIHRRVEAGEIPVERHGHGCFYTPKLTDDDEERVRKEAEEIVNAHGFDLPSDIRPRYYKIDYDRLLYDAQCLSELGVVEIKPLNSVVPPSSNMEDSDWLEAAGLFTRTWIREYQNLVERNFQTLKQSFALFSIMPFTCVVVASLRRGHSSGGLYFVPRADSGSENEVVVVQSAEVEFDGAHLSRIGSEVFRSEYEIPWAYRGNERALRAFAPYPTKSARCYVRDQVYGFLEHEIRDVVRNAPTIMIGSPTDDESVGV